ncbi:MAG: AI-2E family transporter [Candidatus Eremiobacteraeota bacterium]|nr:AI-2E family transporter [Candidatus Eremiobacteraeota bacterium]
MNRRLGPWDWMTERRVTYALKVLIVIALALYLGQLALDFLVRIRTVVYVLIGSIFFAYLIYPAVQRLRRRMPLFAAIAVMYLFIALLLAGVGYFIVPRLADETTMLVHRYPEITARLDALVNDPNDPVTSKLPPFARHEIARIPAQIIAWLKLHGFEAFGHVLFVIAGTFAVVATFIVIPMITAYLLLDLENLKRGIAAIVPARRWQDMLSLLSEIDHVIGGFVRGQLLVAVSVGVLITIALLILHVPYAFLLGLLAAVLDLIPYVGAPVASIPAVISAAVTNGIVNASLVIVAIIVIYQAEGHLIAPNIVSRTVALSPFAVLLSVLIGAELAGLVGALVAIPVVGVLRVIALRVFASPEANEPQP